MLVVDGSKLAFSLRVCLHLVSLVLDNGLDITGIVCLHWAQLLYMTFCTVRQKPCLFELHNYSPQ